MKKLYLIFFLFGISFLFSQQINPKIIPITNQLIKRNSDYETQAQIVSNQLKQLHIKENDFISQTMRSFCEGYCYFSIESRKKMEKMLQCLQKSNEYASSISVNDRQYTAELLINSYKIYDKIADYSVFSYDDFSKIMDIFIKILYEKVKISKILQSAPLELQVRLDLLNIKKTIFAKRKSDELDKMIEELERLISQNSSVIEKNSIKNF